MDTSRNAGVRGVKRLYQLEPYELSQDLIDKQLQLLEKKYGGHVRAKTAALTIQRAYRRYCIAKAFAQISHQAKIERRSRDQLDKGRQLHKMTKNEIPSKSKASLCLHQIAAASFNQNCNISSTCGNNLLSNGSNTNSRCSCKNQNSTVVSHYYCCGSAKHNSNNNVYPVYYFHNHHHHHYFNHRHVDDHVKSVHDASHRVVPKPKHTCSRYLSSHENVISTRSCSSSPVSCSSSSTNSSNSSILQQTEQNFSSSQKSHGDTSRSSAESEVCGEVAVSDIQSFPLDEQSVYTHTSKNRLGHRIVPNLLPSLPDVSRRTVSRFTSSLPECKTNNNNVEIVTTTGRKRNNSVDYESSRPIGYRVAPARDSSSVTLSPVGTYSVSDVIRKRHYRTGLNIFNKKPIRGIAYLIQQGFLENSPLAVARFLVTRKGLAKQMIGEYLGNIIYPFNMAVLRCFVEEIDFSGIPVDLALRKFQTFFRLPGEAQKIERLIEEFSRRYCQCCPSVTASFRNGVDTVFVLSFAIILLNTDLHTPSMKDDKRMKVDDFCRNLRRIDDGYDLDEALLAGIYERVKTREFRTGNDHVSQVLKVQQSIVVKCPVLAVPHRRLVCYCRLYEVHDTHKKEKPGQHQREVFLFNDILVITKIHSRKKNSICYAFRQSYILSSMIVMTFQTAFYAFGLRMIQKWDRKVVANFNARNEHDRSKFVEDLKESIAEMDELEAIRLGGELEKQQTEERRPLNNSVLNLSAEPIYGKFEHRRTSSVISLDSEFAGSGSKI